MYLLVFYCFIIAFTQIDPNFAQNLTLYHVHQPSFHTLDDKDTGDAAGDAFFSTRSMSMPIECADDPHNHDCYNPEVNSTILVTTKVIVEVDSRFGEYARCNVANGTYSCTCGYGHVGTQCKSNKVGREDVGAHFNRTKGSKNYDWWKTNLALKLGGFWYSTLSTGNCKTQSTNCTWRVVETLRNVNHKCQDKLLSESVEKEGSECFNACPQPKNQTSTCWVECYFTTLLGEGSGKGIVQDEGMTKGAIVDAWTQAFQSVEEGGCPEVPDADIF